MYLNQQDQWVGPVSPLVNAAQRNQQAWTVNNSCQYETYNSVFQPSNNAAVASRNFSQPYRQTHNFQLSATPYQVYSPPQRAGLMSNMCQPQVAHPNNQFASSNSQTINQCFPSTSEMHDKRSYENMYTDWSNPASHGTTSTPLLHKQATFNQSLVPVTAKKQQSFHTQIQDIAQQEMPQSYYGPNAKKANFKSGKDDRNAISSPLSGQFVFCNVPQAQQNPPQCRMSARSKANHESNSSYSTLQSNMQILLSLGKANTFPINHAVSQQKPSSTVSSDTLADALSQPPKYTGLHHMVKQSVSQTAMTMSHSNRQMLNSAVPDYFQNSSNSSSLHQEKNSHQCIRNGIPPQTPDNILVAQAGSVGKTKRRHQFRISGNQLLGLLKRQTPVEIPSQIQLPATKNPGLSKSLTCAKGNDCSVQASSAHLGKKAVAVVPPLSQESSENISKRTSQSTSECYKDQKISKPNAEVCSWRKECYDSYNTLGSSQSDSSSTPQSDDSTALLHLKQIPEFNQRNLSPIQTNVAPEEPVSQNIAQHQSSCQTDTETTSSSQSLNHDQPLVETHASIMSCSVEAQNKQENLTELLILKEGEEYSETPYKSSWLNLNAQLNDIDKEFGFPWTMRYRPHQGRTNESSTAAESPNQVSQTQLDPDGSIKQIEDSLNELLSSATAVFFESERDESCYNFKIEVLPSELAKQIYEQTSREDTLEPTVCVENGVSSSELKLHDGTESLIERGTTFSTPEIESGLPLSKGPIKISHHPSVETENSAKGEEETDDHTMRSSSPNRDDCLMETNGETEDGDFSDRTENSSSEHSDCEEDCAQPLQLNRFDIQRKYENTNQEVKPVKHFVKKNHLFDVFHRNNKLIIKRKYAHCKTKHNTSKQSIHNVFQSKKQEKIKDKLKWKTSAADTPSTAEIAVKVLQEGKPYDGQIEIIEDTFEKVPPSREENGSNQITELQKTSNLFLEEECAGPLPVTGVETQIEGEITNLNSNETDLQQAMLKDAVKPYKVFLDKVHDLSSQGECQTVSPQYSKREDHDSRNVTDKHPSPVEVVSSQQEEKDYIQCENNNVTESSDSEESSVNTIADPQILVSNPEEESVGCLQSDVLDTQTQSKITIQDSDNKGVKVAKYLVDKAYPSNIHGCQITDGKRKRQSGKEKEAFPFAKKKDQQAKDLQSRKSNEYVSKHESLVADPSSRFVKLSLYGKSQLGDPNGNQTPLKLPKDLFIHLSPREKSLSEAVCTENYSVKDQIWEKWKESFVPTNAGFKGKPRSPITFSSGQKLKKPLSSQMHISRKQKRCLSLKKKWLLKLEKKERKTGVSSEKK
ncbi:uncharacterized protein LOC114465827 [Gouania willdenowi]|uniref:uncharacterized protein LOC114465827 n=1 Tax=Gouania willdenowi TaxID=441366 RepID=UPI0010548FA7|nr:uncharacterized protein LOC114465827 [Gouania willdenowi]